MTETKLASELTYKDIGRRIRGMHGARGLVSDKLIPTLNVIKEFSVSKSGVLVTVHRNRYETTDTFYKLDEVVTLKY